MAEYGSTWERVDLGGGMFEHIQHMRPISYFENGAYRPMSTDYLSDGSGGHIITDSPMRVSIGDDANGRATRRIHPTRELDVWAEIGRPHNVATREPYPLNAFTRSGNLLTSENNLADIHIWHGGHFSKLGIRLKSTWRTSPPAQFAFPVALQGLTWEGGGVIAKDGIPVMRLTAPVMYDFQNPDLVRPIPWDFVQLGGQWYVVFDTPSTAGMSVPIIDPTLELQPDGTAGVDTLIVQNSATNNFGSSTFFDAGESSAGGAHIRRSLIKFDLSNLPPAAIISSAALTLQVVADLASAVNTLEVYRLKRAWVEDQATWNVYSTGNSWQTAGGFGADDCEQTTIGSLAVSASESAGSFLDIPLTPVTKANLDLGNGWLLKMQTESGAGSYRFASSDNATAASRPELTIVYTESNAPAAMAYYRRLRG